MNSNYPIETRVGSNADKISFNQENSANKNNTGMASLTEGQKITGTVISVDEKVTLNFNGQEVTTPKSVLNNVKPGDVKSFEVVKATGKEIELRLLDETCGNTVKTIKAVPIMDTDWEKVFTQKEQTAKKADLEAEYMDTRNKLNQVASTLTERDCRLLEQEGFQIENFTVDQLARALNRIKSEDTQITKVEDIQKTKAEDIQKTKAEDTQKTKAEDTQKTKAENIQKTKPEDTQKTKPEYFREGQDTNEKKAFLSKSALEKRIKDENLPVTEENINRISSALELSGFVAKMDDKTMQNLIATDAEPTVENIYKAYYSGNLQKMDQLSDTTWKQLKNQVTDVVQSAGYKVTDQNLADARWLIENNLPLTKETFTYKKNLDSIKQEDNKDKVLDKMLEGMKKGINPKDVSLIENNNSNNEQIVADIKTISDEAVVKAVSQDSKLTIKTLMAIQESLKSGDKSQVENIYKAYYSGDLQKTDHLSDVAWKQIKNQVSDEIQSAGYEVNDDTLADARWLIENNLPLTKETITYKNNLDYISQNVDEDEVLNKMLEGMKKGINPKDVSLTQNDNSNNEKTDANINATSEETDDREIFADSTNHQYEELKAKRQLEEIRLKMTTEAAGQLAKKGFSIDTEELSKVVDELRKLEDQAYRSRLKEVDTKESELTVQTLKETTKSIDQLRYLPCSVLGSTLSQRNTQTIKGLLKEGSKLSAEYAKAGTAYETLATVPNTEYGDSIKKAFANADSLLSQMGLDSTQENRRAIRILGYNQMEISQDSINQVKAYDKQVTTMIDNLHPGVAVRMIMDGINPMDMPINELNKTIDNIKEEQGITSEEKYSNYLYNLEKQEGISEEERKAYIGIYRLLYNIYKSDGAALGAVINSDREVTLGNLLTAVRTNKKGSIDSIVNDEFGTLQDISYRGESIAAQLSSFGRSRGLQDSGQSPQAREHNSHAANKDDVVKEQTQYLERILKQIKDELSPEKLMEAGNNMNSESSILNQAQKFTSVASSDKTIWDKIKGVPIEKLLEQLRNTQDLQSTNDEVYAEKVQQIRDICKNSEQSIRFLNDYRMPSTSLNIIMANHVLSNGESPIRKILKQDSENKTESLENSLKETGDLSDTLIDKNTMQDAYEKLESKVNDSLGKACSEEVIDSRRLAELKSMSQQMTFLRTLAGKEFYQIPIETSKGIINMNLTILRGSDTSGKVSVNVLSQSLGNVKAEFSLKDQVLKGFFRSDNQNGLNQLKNYTGEIEEAAKISNITIKQMDFGMQSKENENYSYQLPNNESGSNTVSNSTERILYRIAKAVVQTVRVAENSSSELDKAV